MVYLDKILIEFLKSKVICCQKLMQLVKNGHDLKEEYMFDFYCQHKDSINRSSVKEKNYTHLLDLIMF